MALRRFETDMRLWIWISLTLFAIAWFAPLLGKFGDTPAAALWFILLNYPKNIGVVLYFLAVYTLIFGSASILVGWLLQTLVVMVRDARKRKVEPAGSE